MINIFNYKEFLNEGGKSVSKEENTEIAEIKKETKSLLNDVFDKVTKIEYKNDDKGVPKEVSFYVTELDYGVDIDEPIQKEYSSAVKAKRKYDLSLELGEKDIEETDTDNFYKMTFNIVLKEIDKESLKKVKETPRRLNFEKDSSKQLKDKIKSGKFTKDQEIEMREILDERGVEFDEEDEEKIEKKLWTKMTKKDRIDALTDLGMDKKEAEEIYSDNLNDLPDEIKEYFD
jgi:hypothetical protein